MNTIKSHYNSIDKVVNGYRSFAIIISGIAFVLVVILCFFIYSVSQNKIMVVDGQGDILSASKSSEAEVMQIEADNHIRLFYSRFFSYDKLNYKKRTEMGLYLSGKSGVTLYETYKSKSWYDAVINNDLVIDSYVQKINFTDTNSFEAIGFQKIIRGDVVELRHLDIKGTYDKAVSGRQMEINPHGLIIDNLVIMNNQPVANDPVPDDTAKPVIDSADGSASENNNLN